MRAPCVAHLETAKQLLEFGVVGEAAATMVNLRRCAQTPGCEDWQNCDDTVEETWRAVAEPLPEAKARDESPGQD